jgi:hypothetical protein
VNRRNDDSHIFAGERRLQGNRFRFVTPVAYAMDQESCVSMDPKAMVSVIFFFIKREKNRKRI